MVPIGGIINWSGAIVDIPAGYQLCDGTNGTPNLRDKFVVGAGTTYAVDDHGGAATHTHTMNVVSDRDSVGSDSAVDTSPTDAASSLPPYLALAYIQRLS